MIEASRKRFLLIGRKLSDYTREKGGVAALETPALNGLLMDLVENDSDLLLPLHGLIGRTRFKALVYLAGTGEGSAEKTALLQDIESVFSIQIIEALAIILDGFLGLDRELTERREKASLVPALTGDECWNQNPLWNRGQSGRRALAFTVALGVLCLGPLLAALALYNEGVRDYFKKAIPASGKPNVNNLDVAYIKAAAARAKRADPSLVKFTDDTGSEGLSGYLDAKSVEIDKTCDWTMCVRGMVYKYKIFNADNLGQKFVEEWLGICYSDEFLATFVGATYVDSRDRVVSTEKVRASVVNLRDEMGNPSQKFVGRTKHLNYDAETGSVIGQHYSGISVGFSSEVVHPGLLAILNNGNCSNWFTGS